MSSFLDSDHDSERVVIEEELEKLKQTLELVK